MSVVSRKELNVECGIEVYVNLMIDGVDFCVLVLFLMFRL